MKLNEANTRKQLIDRALESVGWRDEYLNCEYAFTDGKKTPGGGKGYFFVILKNGYKKIF